MKTSLRKLVAMICVLAIAAVLPVMASAEDAAMTLGVAADTATVKAGDTIKVDVSLANNTGWASAQFALEWDPDQLTMLTHEEENEDTGEMTVVGAYTGSALPSTYLDGSNYDMADQGVIHFGLIFNGGNVKKNGVLYTVEFKVADSVEVDDEITLEVSSEGISSNEIVDGNSIFTDALAAGQGGATVTLKVVGDVVPSSSATESSTTQSTATTASKADATTATKADATTATKADDTTATKADDVTTATEADDTTEADVTTTTEADTDDVVTGETTTMIVLALVLMAGSAVALISMKKKALSK